MENSNNLFLEYALKHENSSKTGKSIWTLDCEDLKEGYDQEKKNYSETTPLYALKRCVSDFDEQMNDILLRILDNELKLKNNSYNECFLNTCKKVGFAKYVNKIKKDIRNIKECVDGIKGVCFENIFSTGSYDLILDCCDIINENMKLTLLT